MQSSAAASPSSSSSKGWTSDGSSSISLGKLKKKFYLLYGKREFESSRCFFFKAFVEIFEFKKSFL
jgi:hypothetical protein